MPATSSKLRRGNKQHGTLLLHGQLQSLQKCTWIKFCYKIHCENVSIFRHLEPSCPFSFEELWSVLFHSTSLSISGSYQLGHLVRWPKPMREVFSNSTVTVAESKKSVSFQLITNLSGLKSWNSYQKMKNSSKHDF